MIELRSYRAQKWWRKRARRFLLDHRLRWTTACKYATLEIWTDRRGGWNMPHQRVCVVSMTGLDESCFEARTRQLWAAATIVQHSADIARHVGAPGDPVEEFGWTCKRVDAPLRYETGSKTPPVTDIVRDRYLRYTRSGEHAERKHLTREYAALRRVEAEARRVRNAVRRDVEARARAKGFASRRDLETQSNEIRDRRRALESDLEGLDARKKTLADIDRDLQKRVAETDVYARKVAERADAVERREVSVARREADVTKRESCFARMRDAASSGVVRLRVGGEAFETRESTLLCARDPSPFFEAWFSDRWRETADSLGDGDAGAAEQARFLDRDPDAFRAYLSCLRSGADRLAAFGIASVHDVANEARFFGNLELEAAAEAEAERRRELEARFAADAGCQQRMRALPSARRAWV